MAGAARSGRGRRANRAGSSLGPGRGLPSRRSSRLLVATAAAAVAIAAGITLWAVSRTDRPAVDWKAAGAGGPSDPAGAAAAVADLVVEVLAVYPHDPAAYTQGLLWDGSTLLESTGLYGESSLRRVALSSGEVLRQVPLARTLFGEGLALLPAVAGGPAARLLQLTWREGTALSYDAATFAPGASYGYTGEGWGLCFDGRRLVMSDGGADLTFRDPADFVALGRVAVTLRGRPVAGLNELECVGGAVWANVYTTSMIVRIDPESGRITATVDASGLLTPEEARGAEVLNGIAHNPATDTFYLTGKRWPKLFEVRFSPRSPG